MTVTRALMLAPLLWLLLMGCAEGPGDLSPWVPDLLEGVQGVEWQASSPDPAAQPYWPDRRDYVAFRSAHDGLLEPNYLPFMVHRIPGSALVGDDLIFCRWPAARMPLRVYVHRPVIPESLQNEFRPIDPERYVEAAARALEIWQAELEGLVRFRRVDDAATADLEIRLRGEVAPIDHEREVLGTTTALLSACKAKGWASDSEQLVVGFAVPELDLFVADRHGLLMPDQVARVALHELGHALGMFGHSPISSDLMYRVARDGATAESLSQQDVNSFVSLYSLPNGSHYAAVVPGGLPERPPPGPPSGAPSLAFAPHVDTRFGFELQAPRGWLRVETPHGLFTANGPLWDYDASIELLVWPAATIEEFLDRFADSLLEGAWLRRRAPLVVKGRRALRIEFEDDSGTRAEELTFVELDNDRVLLIHAQCPASASAAWQPWLRASLESLEIWGADGKRSADR